MALSSFILSFFLFVILLQNIDGKLIIPSKFSLQKKQAKKSNLSPVTVFSSDDDYLQEKVIQLRGGNNDQVDWRYFVAGSVSAAFSHGITTPIDVVKTKMQTNPEKYNKGMVHAAGEIISHEGVGILLAGLGPTVVGYGLEGSLKFGLYETFKKLFGSVTPYRFFNSLLASVVAGAVASIVLCPMEEARIKMVEDPSWAKENVVSAISRLIREHGLFASFAGLTAMLFKQIPYTMGKNVSFDMIKKLLHNLAVHLSIGEKELKWIITLAAAFLTSVVACICSQPGDMILTASSATGKSFLNTLTDIYRNNGFGGFYVGTQARLAHVASIITIQLVVYDFMKTVLGLPASESH